MMQISSPRAPRSSHQRSPSTRTSPRNDRVRPFGGHRIDQPNYEGTSPVLVPENLRDADQTFNIDPAAGLLESAGETYQAPVEPAGRRRLVNGFVGGLRKVMQRNRAPDNELAYPEPALVHEEEREYEPVPRADLEMPVPDTYGSPIRDARYGSPTRDGRYGSPTQDARYGSPTRDGRFKSPTRDARYASPTFDARYASPTPDAQYAAPPADAQYATPQVHTEAHYARSAEQEPHRRQESSTTVSETVHTTQEHYEGTTMVGHEMVAPRTYVSPQFVEPELASDYAKMDSPPRSEASFGSYMSRLQHFFKVVNALPWIAEDRVTVDYYPGRREPSRNEYERDVALEMPMPTPRPRPRSGAPRTVKSWYNSNPPQEPIDLLAGSSPSVRPDEVGPPQQPRSLVGQMYSSDTPMQNTGSMPPQKAPVMVAATSDMASVPPPPPPSRSRRVPPPRFSPEPQEEEQGGYYEPRYPNGGYVPYDQQPMAPTYTYTVSSVGSAARSTRR